MLSILYHLTVALSITIALAQPAHAYLDPGTGSIILQSVIGAVAAGLIVGRSYLYRLKKWLGLLPKPAANGEGSPE